MSYVKGIHNIKIGAQYEHTFITERDTFGMVDPTANAPCLNADGSPDTNPTLTNPSGCTGCAANAESRLYSASRLLRPDPDGAAARFRRLPEQHQRLTTILRPRRHQGIRSLRPGHHHHPQLDLQPGPARRQIQRHHQRRAGRTAPRYRLQHQADQHGAAGFLCPHHGDVRSTKTWCWRAWDATIR